MSLSAAGKAQACDNVSERLRSTRGSRRNKLEAGAHTVAVCGVTGKRPQLNLTCSCVANTSFLQVSASASMLSLASISTGVSKQKISLLKIELFIVLQISSVSQSSPAPVDSIRHWAGCYSMMHQEGCMQCQPSSKDANDAS